MLFKDIVREKRLASKLSLRQFAYNKGLDAAYISRLENGLAAAPRDSDKLAGLATALGIQEESKEWVEFFDAAALSHNSIPEDLADNPVVPRLLPALYRTIRAEKLTEGDISKLEKLILDSRASDDK